jgi:hypothetical protein
MATHPNVREYDKWPVGKPPVLIFDVNETLIDFESMQPLFERVFGDKRAMRERLGHPIMYSMTITLSGLCKDYWAIGGGCFEMVGKIYGIDIKPDDTEALRPAMKTMPAHRDSEEGLSLLKDAGFQMATLTNSQPTLGSKSPGERRSLTHLREAVQHRGLQGLQAAPVGVPLRSARLGRAPRRLLHGCDACVRHDRPPGGRHGGRPGHTAR